MGRGGSRGASWEPGQEAEKGEEGKSNGSQRRVHFAAPHQAILAAGEAWQGSATKERQREREEGRVQHRQAAAGAGSSRRRRSRRGHKLRLVHISFMELWSRFGNNVA